MTNEESLAQFFEQYNAELAALDLLEDGLVAAIEKYDAATTADVLLQASEEADVFCVAIEKACTDIGIIADKVTREHNTKLRALIVSPRPHGFETLGKIAGNIQAPEGAHWVCFACNKKAKWKYGFDASGARSSDRGYDEACMMNSELVEDEVEE